VKKGFYGKSWTSVLVNNSAGRKKVQKNFPILQRHFLLAVSTQICYSDVFFRENLRKFEEESLGILRSYYGEISGRRKFEEIWRKFKSCGKKWNGNLREFQEDRFSYEPRVEAVCRVVDGMTVVIMCAALGEFAGSVFSFSQWAKLAKFTSWVG
jgi:hypothetical protein